MLLTPNYLLKKIELADSPPDITVINANWDIIDTKIKEAFTGISGIKIPVTSVNNKTGAVNLAAVDVGLGNVTNESKSTMFTSPAFTGIPVAPTAVSGTNTTQVATTAFVTAAVGAKNSITGNSGTATKLSTPRTINGVSFDGSANITIPASGIRTTDEKTLEEFKTSTNASLEQIVQEQGNLKGAINEVKDSVGKDKIGDFKLSGVKPSSDWLPLDGGYYESSEYPEFYNYLGGPIGSGVVMDPVARVFPAPYINMYRAFFKDNKIFLIDQMCSIYISTDKGVTWVKASNLKEYFPEYSSANILLMSTRNVWLIDNKIYVYNFGNVVHCTVDGYNWTKIDISKAGFSILGSGGFLSYGNGLWVLTAYGTNKYSTSTDLITWTPQKVVSTLYSSYYAGHVVYNKGTWYFGASNGYVYRTTDFITWNEALVVSGREASTIIIENDVIFVPVYISPTSKMYVSTDGGLTFTLAAGISESYSFQCVKYFDGYYYAGYSHGKVYKSSNPKTGWVEYINVGSSEYNRFYFIEPCGGALLFGGSAFSANLLYASKYVSADSFRLPVVSPNMYVKVKEV